MFLKKHSVLFCSIIGYIFIYVLVLFIFWTTDTDTEISYFLSCLMSYDYSLLHNRERNAFSVRSL